MLELITPGALLEYMIIKASISASVKRGSASACLPADRCCLMSRNFRSACLAVLRNSESSISFHQCKFGTLYGFGIFLVVVLALEDCTENHVGHRNVRTEDRDHVSVVETNP